MKRFVIVLVMAVVLLLPIQAGAQFGFDMTKAGITVGAGYAIPVRSQLFVDETNGGAFYKFAAIEYPLKVDPETQRPRLSLGLSYGGANFDLRDDGNGLKSFNSGFADQSELKTITWGPYGLWTFDLIKGNAFEGFVKFGGANSTVEGATEGNQWQAFGGIGLEWHGSGNARLRAGVDFWDTFSGQDESAGADKGEALSSPGKIGSFFVYASVVLHPFTKNEDGG